jgi:hypothetical protein
MPGTGQIQMTTGFNRDPVTTCRVYFQLKSSYGSLSAPMAWDCTALAHRGGRFTFPADIDPPYNSSVGWGYGRSSGDQYTQYAWMEIWTVGGHYDSRPWAAKATVTNP